MPSSARPSRQARRDDGDRIEPGDDDRRRCRSPERKRRRVVESRRRSGSPEADSRGGSTRRHRGRRDGRTSTAATAGPVGDGLPCSARPLSKSDLRTFAPLFVHYLRLQKQKEADEMDEREFKGRWKSFVGKWNRAELAEGWYDAELFSRIVEEAPPVDEWWARRPETLSRPTAQALAREDDNDNDEDEDGDGNSNHAKEKHQEQDQDRGEDSDDYGPTLPRPDAKRHVGAQVPSLQDISLRNERARESREVDAEALREARKVDRVQQKERLEELVPRAEAGTRERKLEKRQEVNERMREIRSTRSPGLEAADEKEIMGGGDSVEEYKRMQEREQRRKTERQLRREEVDRARREEVAERRRAWQEREDGTVNMLRELARQRFG